jgi:hypothetical protein
MRIVVASRNPVKVAAARNAFAALLPLVNELYRCTLLADFSKLYGNLWQPMDF